MSKLPCVPTSRGTSKSPTVAESSTIPTPPVLLKAVMLLRFDSSTRKKKKKTCSAERSASTSVNILCVKKREFRSVHTVSTRGQSHSSDSRLVGDDIAKSYHVRSSLSWSLRRFDDASRPRSYRGFFFCYQRESHQFNSFSSGETFI